MNAATTMVTSQTTSTSFNKAKEGSLSTLSESIPTSVLSSSSRAAGSRTRVICGLARGDLPVRFQWLKDGIPISAKTSSTSNLFLAAFHNAKMSPDPFAYNSDYINVHKYTTKKFDPNTVQITTIDPFSSLLTISSLEDQHTGNYTCVATNPAGHAHYTASLTVKGDFLTAVLSSFFNTY